MKFPGFIDISTNFFKQNCIASYLCLHAFRLNRETGSKITDLHFFNTYTRPIIEYAGIIWNNNSSQFAKLVKYIRCQEMHWVNLDSQYL